MSTMKRIIGCSLLLLFAALCILSEYSLADSESSLHRFSDPNWKQRTIHWNSRGICRFHPFQVFPKKSAVVRIIQEDKTILSGISRADALGISASEHSSLFFSVLRL